MSLEKNIERIADALDAIAKAAGARMPAEGNNTTLPLTGQHAAQQMPGMPPMQQPPVPGAGQPLRMQQTPPVSLPGGGGMPWQGTGNGMQVSGTPPTQQPGAPSQQPATLLPPPAGTGPLPTTAAAQQYTFDQLAVATANLASSGKDVFPILSRFGISMLMDLPREKFGEFAAALREAGAVI